MSNQQKQQLPYWMEEESIHVFRFLIDSLRFTTKSNEAKPTKTKRTNYKQRADDYENKLISIIDKRAS